MTGSTDPPRHRRSPQERYRSLSNFYAADSRRMRSRELDIGLWWLDEAGGPLHRAAWVRDTGELYLTRLGPSEDGGGEVEVLAIVAEQEQLQVRMKRVTPYVRILGAASGLLILLIAGMAVWQQINKAY